VIPVKVDVFDLHSLEKAMNGCSVIYYLIHSMESSVKDFVKKDKIAAQNTVIMANKANIERIIYLGGLGEEIIGQKLSKHLQSRIEVANILESCSVPVTTLKAAIIIGSGSAAFEMMRYLSDRLPAMITPKWLRTKNQPIAIENVLTYLLKVLDCPETIGETYDIGGPDIVTYKQFIESYIQITCLPKRIILPIPIFSPNISSYWIKLITGISSALARPLINGMKNEVTVKDTRIQKIIPQRLIGHKEAIQRALDYNQYKQTLPYRRNRTIPSPWHHPGDAKWAGGSVFQDHKSITITSSNQEGFPPILKMISEKRSSLFLSLYFKFGSFLNNLFKGRRIFPSNVWIETEKRKNEYLQLTTPNQLPGKTFLTYMIKRTDNQSFQLHQIFRIIPKGILGTYYWLFFTPFFNRYSKKLIVDIAESYQGTGTKRVVQRISFTKPSVSNVN
jgi:uncharacterized protein YbjT (DUF2867 family)